MHWWEFLIVAGLVLILVYTLIPDLLMHRLGLGVWKRQYSAGVAITFDDGPSPKYTREILDVLAKYGVPATFFVVGENAAANPETVKAILDRGHKLGVHCQQHAYAWFLSPWATWRKWDQGVAALEQLTGQTVEWIRPPWGTFNLALWWWLKSRKKQAVLWNVEGHDWQARRSPEEIAQRVTGKTREGSIVVLHDARGDPGAPANTVRALDLICRKILEEQKLPIVSLELPQWSVWRRVIFVLWEKWERLYARLNKIERISADNVFRLSQSHYQGPDIYSESGQLLALKGDLVGEIHFDNVRFLGKETDPAKIGLRAMRQAKESLPGLAHFIVENPAYQGIKVFLGLTLIHRGVQGFGFQVREVPATFSTRLIGLLQRIIMRIYHPAGKARGSSRLGTQPKLVWISREELLARWLPAAQQRNACKVKKKCDER